MMDHITDKLVSAIGDMDTAYLEEALDFDGAKTKTLRSPNCLPRSWQCWSYWACP